MTDFFGHSYPMYRGPPTTIRPGGGASPLTPLALDLQTTNRNTEHISHSTTSTAPR